jgi:DNA-binding response OmpR family regulator
MPKKMLVVDDEKNIQELIKAVFMDQDSYLVDCAGDGLEGLDKARATLPDIVLLDANLPRISGYELCQRIKADRRTAKAKILMLSGLAQSYDVLKAKEAGADAYFTKPFEIQDLVQAVRTLAEQTI